MDMIAYEALKRAGHSPAKAAEICLDAKRGDRLAIQWIEGCKQLVRHEALTASTVAGAVNLLEAVNASKSTNREA